MIGRVASVVVVLACACVRPPPGPKRVPALEVSTWRPHYRIDGGHLIASATITNASREDWSNAAVVLVTPAVTCMPEDVDQFEDDDGCADPDNDRDSLPDLDDACANEPENYNGALDADGCPDRGRVVTQPPSTEILDLLFFARGQVAIERNAEAMLTSIASAIVTTPDIGKVEVRGHAVAGEPSRIGVWRAATVRAALIARGVPAARLSLADAATREPLDARRAPQGRVSFRVIERVDEVPPWPSVRPTKAGAAPVHALTTRVPISTLSVRHGDSTTVQLFDLPVQATHELWFEPGVSLYHPMRTVTITNPAPHGLPRGPVTWTGGGDGELDDVAPGAAVRIRLGLDRTTTLVPASTLTPESSRIVAIRGVRIDLEDTVSIRTTVAAPAGRDVKGLRDIVEHHRRQRTLGLPDDRTDLTPYLATLPGELATKLQVLIALRAELSAAEADLAASIDEVAKALPRRTTAVLPRFDAASARVTSLWTKLRDAAMPLRYP